VIFDLEKYRDLEIRRFQLKIAIFSQLRVFIAPAEVVPFGIRYRCKGTETRMMGLSDGHNSFKIGLAV